MLYYLYTAVGIPKACTPDAFHGTALIWGPGATPGPGFRGHGAPLAARRAGDQPAVYQEMRAGAPRCEGARTKLSLPRQLLQILPEPQDLLLGGVELVGRVDLSVAHQAVTGPGELQHLG